MFTRMALAASLILAPLSAQALQAHCPYEAAEASYAYMEGVIADAEQIAAENKGQAVVMQRLLSKSDSQKLPAVLKQMPGHNACDYNADTVLVQVWVRDPSVMLWYGKNGCVDSHEDMSIKRLKQALHAAFDKE